MSKMIRWKIIHFRMDQSDTVFKDSLKKYYKSSYSVKVRQLHVIDLSFCG